MYAQQFTTKLQADIDLMRCVAEYGGWPMALLMFAGVSLFGGLFWRRAKRMTHPPMPMFWPASSGLLFIGPQEQPAMAADNFDRVMTHILRHEGGYVDHPRDPGGATNLGVTIGTLSAHLGRQATKAEVKALTKETVLPIYRARYWNKISGDELPPGVDLCVMDAAVNSGPSRGAKWLQRAVGADPDGMIGNKTLAAADAADPTQTIERMCDDRLAFLKRLSTWGTFGKGWGRRVSEIRAAALEMARENPAQDEAVAPAPAPRPPEPIATPTTGGPTSKATGGAVGAALPNIILLLAVKLGIIPAEVASDPETILLLTGLLTALGGWVGTYLAPKNAEARASS